MADSYISLGKFTGQTAMDWNEWLEDYKCYADIKKWSKEKQAANLRFFVTAEVRECVRAHAQLQSDIDTIDSDVKALLGGAPNALMASQAIDDVKYEGSVLIMIQKMKTWAKYVTTSSEVDQLVLLHLQRQLPLSFAEEVVKENCTTLEEAVKVVQGLERAQKVRVGRLHDPQPQVGRVARPASPSASHRQSSADDSRQPDGFSPRTHRGRGSGRGRPWRGRPPQSGRPSPASAVDQGGQQHRQQDQRASAFFRRRCFACGLWGTGTLQTGM